MDVRPSRLRSRRILPVIILSSLVLAGLVAPTGVGTRDIASAATCPPGYVRYADLKSAELRAFRGTQGAALAGLYDHHGENLCVTEKHPESMLELNRAFIENQSELLAPAGAVKAGAFRSAVAQRDALRRQAPGTGPWGNSWKHYGNGPLNADVEPYGVAALGNGDVAGRITDFEYVAEKKALYAASSQGGVWKSTNLAKTWKSVGESLPTQVIGSIAWTPANGGTLLALSGDNSFGHYSYEGFGSYYTTNDGKTWKRSKGIPDEAMGFKITVDPTNPREIYAATGAGLFRSTDAGRSFVNVKLPTGECAGKSNRVKPCLLANIVTDVAVQHPGGITEAPGGIVVAAVGWRAGADLNPDGTIQSPNNGLYISQTGAPGSFEKSSQQGFAPQANIGRVEMGAAYGPDQDHNYLYAMVQDAVVLAGTGPLGIDVPEVCSGTPDPVGNICTPGRVPAPTVLQGVYVSADFGETWTLMANAAQFQNPASGSALAGPLTLSGGFGPGVQAWYNMWIQPDPTVADPALGIPTRLLLGLEEVWQNELPTPQNGPTQFKVIGRYFSGSTCLFLDLQGLLEDTTGFEEITGVPIPAACPTDREDALEATTTPHPDQHMAAFIPDGEGGVTLVVGNDGGAYTQTLAAGEDFSNAGWGNGANQGMDTLQPYHAVVSGDGTAWLGLQDNGTAKIEPKQKHRYVMTFGGDGHFVAVDPDNSKIAFSETPYADMRATTDGGVTWAGMAPPITNSLFNHPYVMDPVNSKHLVTAGRQVVETMSGAGTGTSDWKEVFNLGTHQHRGDADAASTSDAGDDPALRMTAIDAFDKHIYVGFCGPCDMLGATRPFINGIATNVGGNKPARLGEPDGWHFAKAKGLPNRYITGMAIDQRKPRTVYVTLGGYSRRWTPPGVIDRPSRVGKGHVFVSHDAGNTFRNISANLPDVRHTWVERRADDILVASDVGVFVKKVDGKTWSILGRGLPGVPIHSIETSPRDLNLVVAATHGRGVWAYRFGPPKPYRYGSSGKAFPKPGKIKGKVLAGPFGFEVDAEGWTTFSAGGPDPVGGAQVTAVHTEFRRQPPGHASSAAFAASPYLDMSTAILTSPKLTHPGGTAELSWFERRDTEGGYDFMAIDWSSDGKLWNAVAAIDGQNEAFPDFSEYKLKFWAPKGSLYVRYRFASDQLVSSPPYTGIAIDDVTLKY